MSEIMSELDKQYNQIADTQQKYLTQIQEAFNVHCNEITDLAKKQIALIPESDSENRQKIVDGLKLSLASALQQYKEEINTSGTETRIKLEQIHSKRESLRIAEIENVISKI